MKLLFKPIALALNMHLCKSDWFENNLLNDAFFFLAHAWHTIQFQMRVIPAP